MADRRIVVTGATGLIGRSLVAKLVANGDRVIAVGRGVRTSALPEKVSYHQIDLACLSSGSLRVLGDFDGAIHLAQAPGWHDFPRAAGSIASVALAATAHLAEAAVAAGASTFVLASSGGVYGPSTRPIVETDPIRPAAELGFYLAAKAASERLLEYFSPHLTVHILRPFFVYGPGQGRAFLVPRLVESVRSGTPIRIDGGRGPRLNPIHSDDAACAFAEALDLRTPLVANIAGPNVVSVRQIAEMTASILRGAARFENTDRAPDDYVADTGRMVTAFGPPPTGFATGLTQLISPDEAAWTAGDSGASENGSQ